MRRREEEAGHGEKQGGREDAVSALQAGMR